MREIKITELQGLQIGQTENAAAGTGCSVFLFGRDGAPAGLDIRGGGPASRESTLLDPLTTADIVHALVFAGGSAYGLSAAGGVMRFLREQGIGFPVGPTVVPLVCQSDLFDLAAGASDVYPDEAMGYAACRAAGNYRDGCFGAGTGATVGKLLGMDYCMKSGMGSYAVRIGALEVGAVAAVNSLGDVFDWRTGRKAAGLLAEDRRHFRSSEEQLFRSFQVVNNRFTGNTTLGAVFTNAAFGKTALCKIAGMAQDGYARSISPVHTSADGDSIYAVSLGGLSADRDMVGALAARVMSEAIVRAVRSADAAYGFPSAKDILPD